MNEVRIYPGAFQYMVDSHEWSDFSNDYDHYKDRVPEDLFFHEVVQCYKEDGYGVTDLYVVRDLDGRLYGLELFRMMGKHADYDEFYENYFAPDKYDAPDYEAEDFDIDPKDWYTFKLLKVDMVPRYKFENTD
jgi:hypothetical protein